MTGKLSPWETAAITLPCAALLLVSWMRWAPVDFTEACGFVTGAVCVWLITRDNMWNWPIGLANNVFFAVLFWKARLFADMGLQGVYLILGIWGWWQWLRGGANHSRLAVTRTRPVEWIGIAVFLVAGTWGLRELLLAVNGAAPFWDSLTTILCLAAQYLLCLKRFENWWLWIAADLIYVPLYFHRDLPLTGILYAGFIVLCVTGLVRWRKELHRPVP